MVIELQERIKVITMALSAAAAKSLQSCPTLATLWTVALQTPLSMGFPRQEYWSGLPFLLQGIFLTQDLNPVCIGVDSLLSGQPGKL